MAFDATDPDAIAALTAATEAGRVAAAAAAAVDVGKIATE